MEKIAPPPQGKTWRVPLSWSSSVGERAFFCPTGVEKTLPGWAKMAGSK